MRGRTVSPDGSAPKAVGNRFELVVLDVWRIGAYEYNPRRGPNPEYDRIKASIRAAGLDQPLIVTQRPGEPDYIVHAGGNTRLRILQELFDETGDRRFGDVPCVIRQWTGEADILLAHLRENDLRGELTFLDRTLAVAGARRFFEKESGESLTHARLAERLRRCGYSVSQSLLAQMAYAMERLRPWLPQALEGGIGRPQVARIRALDRAARAIWLERVAPTEAEYDETFATLCGRYDTVDWDLANLRRALEAEVAERAEMSIQAVSLEIDHRMSVRKVGPLTRRTFSPGGEPACEDTRRDRVGAHEKTPRPWGQWPEHVVPTDGEKVGYFAAAPDPDPLQAGSWNGEKEEGSAWTAPGIPTPADLMSVRVQLWTLANHLAQRHGLGGLVQPMRERGLGFVPQDRPDPARVHRLDPKALPKMPTLWWHLAACAEITVAPLDARLPGLSEESALRRALVDKETGLLLARVGTFHPGRMGNRFWCQLDGRDWRDLLSLMQTYRALRLNASIDDWAVWSRT